MEIERPVNRIWFLMGDCLALAVSSALVATATGLLLPSDWPIWVNMPLGMLFGMLLSLPLWLVFSVFFGVIEVMIQLMLGSMLAGMVAVMTDVQGALFDQMVGLMVLGLKCGLVVWTLLAGADWVFRKQGIHG